MEKRGARAAEFVECLKAIWTQSEVEYRGQFYDVPLSRVEPKPVQQPHPPILMGGAADVALRRIGRIADGWISSSRTDLATIGQSIDLIRSAASEAGRDPGALRFVTRGVVRLGSFAPTDRVPLQGSADQIRSDLEALAAAGVTEVFLDLNWDPETVADDVGAAAALDNAERVMTELAPG